MSKAILIGNGVSSRDHELGELIDSYDTVIRFNWYQTEGEEKYVGSKTDIWFTSIFDPVRFKKNDSIFTHSWDWNKRVCCLWPKFIKARKKNNDTTKCIHKTDVTILYELMRYRSQTTGRIRRVSQPTPADHIFSSYAMAAFWILFHSKLDNLLYPEDSPCQNLPRCDKIDVYGFDWWLMGKKGFVFDDNVTVSESYRPNEELSLFSQFHMEGKLKDLNPHSDFSKFYE